MSHKEKGYKDPMSMKDHWSININASANPEGRGDNPAGAFLPRPGKYRAQPHVKVNECDH